jgi:hypothetical protein
VSHEYTTHGHPCCRWAPRGERPAGVARCGGPGLCKKCLAEAAKLHGRPDDDPLRRHGIRQDCPSCGRLYCEHQERTAIAAAEFRGAQRQREADVKALRDREALAEFTRARRPADKASGWAPLSSVAGSFAADYLSALPLAASPEETQP